jgi:hypothetical protein
VGGLLRQGVIDDVLLPLVDDAGPGTRRSGGRANRTELASRYSAVVRPGSLYPCVIMKGSYSRRHDRQG